MDDIIQDKVWQPRNEYQHTNVKYAYGNVFPLYDSDYIVFDIDDLSIHDMLGVYNLDTIVDKIFREIEVLAYTDTNIDSYMIARSSDTKMKDSDTIMDKLHVYIGLTHSMDVAEYYARIPTSCLHDCCEGFINIINIRQEVTIRISPKFTGNQKDYTSIITPLVEAYKIKGTQRWDRHIYYQRIARLETWAGPSQESTENTQRNLQFLVRE